MSIIKTIFPYVIIAILAYLLVIKPEESDTITIPEKTGSFKVDNPEPIVKWDTIYKNNIVEKIVMKENPLNKELLKKYENSQDSIIKLNLYKDAITVRDYRQVFKDAQQDITVLSKVTGRLESQQIDYNIVEQQVKFNNPTEGLYIGVGSSLSYRQIELPSLSVEFSYIDNKKIYSLGLGINQTIKIRIQHKLF